MHGIIFTAYKAVKKLLTILLFICYAITSSGATFHVHYCGGEIAAVNFKQTSDKEGCPECGMTQEKEGCCKDEKIVIKTSDKHKPSSNDLSNDSFVIVISKNLHLTDIATLYTFHFQDTYNKHFFPDASPPYILFCTMLV